MHTCSTKHLAHWSKIYKTQTSLLLFNGNTNDCQETKDLKAALENVMQGCAMLTGAAGIDLLIERVFPANGQVTPPPPQ